MYEYSEKQDIWLFENDFSSLIYNTDEGKAVRELLDSDDFDNTIRKTGVPPIALELRLEKYWYARNATEVFHVNGKDKTFRELVA